MKRILRGSTWERQLVLGRVSVFLVACWCLSGCMIVQVGVTNPMPELTTVAVAPFFNQSSERAIDGRRVALAYASELQKIPGIEVIPVGVVETRMREKGLADLSGPEDALKLAELLNADAIVIGSITEYRPYYPPRIGLSVAWYSRYRPLNSHDMPIDPLARERLKEDLDRIHGLGVRRNAKRYARKTAKTLSDVADGFFLDERPENGWGPFREAYEGTGEDDSPGSAHKKRRRHGRVPSESELEETRPPSAITPRSRRSHGDSDNRHDRLKPEPDCTTIGSPRRLTFRGQSPVLELWPPAPQTGRRELRSESRQQDRSVRLAQSLYSPPRHTRAETSTPTPPRLFQADPRRTRPIQQTVGQSAGLAARLALRAKQHQGVERVPLPRPIQPLVVPVKMEAETLAPIMSYTRVFDAADSDLVAIWRDYLETTGDQRPAGWVAQLYWSDNFLRFTARLMITEMFQLHGGEAKRRIILKLRKHR